MSICQVKIARLDPSLSISPLSGVLFISKQAYWLDLHLHECRYFNYPSDVIGQAEQAK